VEIAAWLRNLGLERYEAAFRDAEITAAALPELTDADLRELGLPLGPRKVLLRAIASLQPAAPVRGRPDDAPPVQISGPSAEPQRTMPQAERRQLTVMFADLVGSTALSTRLDPEDVREVLHAYQNAVTGEIARVGGHAARLMGDGVLAYFGWPHAHEDDAERAVRAGLAIVAAVSRLCTPDGEPLAVRVGIATGLVVVGDLDDEGAAQEETVVGETPNLAARLQAAAEPGTVLIADGTRRLLGGLFEVQDLGAVSLKGFAEPVSMFRVLCEHPASSRFEAQHSGRSLPMVGRDQELALVLERWQQAASSEGQAMLLVGEAGIGKSRLVQAVLDTVAAADCTTLRYQCSPHHTGTALWPVIQQLGFAASLDPADSASEKFSKLERLLGKSDGKGIEAAALLAALLGIEGEGASPAPNLSPHQQRARTLAVLVEQLLELAHGRPVLMVIEDAHWVDPTTHELLGEALDRIADARVLMLITSRPDNQPSLGGHPHVTRLTLNRLGRSPSEAIVAQLAGGRELPSEVLAEIAARTDGVPLFVEELTKAVLDTGRGAAVPGSLHASLMARLDRVPGVKEVAQVAACIGREFSCSLLARIAPLTAADLQKALERLAASELVFRRGTPPDATYTFKHALVRDAAHESLLNSSRQVLHARIVRVLEEHFPETAVTEPELLARHCMEAGRTEQAVEYWRQAGQQALARSAMAEAVAHLSRGLEVLKGIAPGPDRQRRELELELALGRASIAAKGFAAPQTGRAYTRARELCTELGEVPELFPVLYGQSVFHFQRGELTRAHEVARDLLRLAEERGDPAAQVTGHRMVGSTLCQLGRFRESRDHFEAALALYDPERDRTSSATYAIDSRVMSLSWLAHLYAILGDPEQAVARDAAVPAHVRELTHPNTTAVALAWGCIFRQLLRDPSSARDLAQAAIALATEQGFPLYAAVGSVVYGWSLTDAGQAEDGIAKIRRGRSAYASTGAEMWSAYFLGLEAEACGRSGQAREGLELVAAALAQVSRIEGRWIEAELYRVQGELLLAVPDPDEVQAEACLNKALAVAREQGAVLWELRAASSLSRLQRDKGKQEEAYARLALVLGRFSERADTADLSLARGLLSALV
jgi:class 3 adenylate cyclase/predicted ATPase/ABC-type transport system involved in cytochrome c biogenesis ATPase subunit